MTFSKVLALAGLALIAGVSPGWAADFGGVKNMGGGVAISVPAPAPVPTYDYDSDWYIGLAIGANISQSATIKDSDTDNLGNSSSGKFARDSDDIGASPIFGLTFGRYITPSLRAEIAIDYSPNETISKDGILQYSATNSAFNPTAGIDTNHFNDIYRRDTVKLSRTTGLVNLLYDIPTGTRFTPYIGGGVGFSWRKIRRTYSEASTCAFSTNPDAIPTTGACVNTPTLPSSLTPSSGSETKDQLDFAAAVQAGIAYNITDQIIWDNGWQMLWEGGSIASSAPSASGENRIVYKDAVLQQFRSGIRIRFD